MELSLRKTSINKLDYILSSCPSKDDEGIMIAYKFVKELFCRVCERSLMFCSSKYHFTEYPFLYRERQLDSVVLPVISELCKGIVIAEYPIIRDSYLKGYEKDNSKGRIDYWCIYKDYSFIIEMKHSYEFLNNNITNGERLIKRWEKMTIGQLQDIRKDAHHFGEKTNGIIRIGLHFITPYSSCDRDKQVLAEYITKQKDILIRLSEDVSQLKPKTTTPNFLASWSLPNKEKYLDVPFNGTYPGLMLLGKMFPSIQHVGSI